MAQKVTSWLQILHAGTVRQTDRIRRSIGLDFGQTSCQLRTQDEVTAALAEGSAASFALRIIERHPDLLGYLLGRPSLAAGERGGPRKVGAAVIAGCVLFVGVLKPHV